MSKLWLGIRATCFYIGFYLVTIVHALLSLLVAKPLPFVQRFKFVTLANYFYIFWLRLCCGVKVKLEGAENLPTSGPYVLLANHQSEWETLYLQTLIRPQSPVLKKELLDLPFFGWALKLIEPIALDRSKKRGALKQLLSDGKERLDRGINVVVFPQGTRLEVGQQGKFNKGGALLACSAGVPVVTLVHNAGLLWPGKQFSKTPGTVTVRIGPVISTEGKTVDEVHQVSEHWLLTNMQELAEK